jgi:PPE-repeat protein
MSLFDRCQNLKLNQINISYFYAVTIGVISLTILLSIDPLTQSVKALENNIGFGNVGSSNFGFGNTGNNNIGIGLDGDNQVGIGSLNSGFGNIGFFNSGTGNIGIANSGSY